MTNINIQDLGYSVDPVCFPCSSIEPLISRCRPEPSGSLTRLISKNLPAAHTVEHLEHFRDRGRGWERRSAGLVVLGKSRAMVIFPLADVQNHASPRPPTVVSYRHSFLPFVVLAPASSALPATRTHACTHADVRVRANLGMRGGEREAERKRERKRRERKRERWSTSPSFARGDSLSRLRIVEMNLSPENLRKSRRNEKQEERLSCRADFVGTMPMSVIRTRLRARRWRE